MTAHLAELPFSAEQQRFLTDLAARGSALRICRLVCDAPDGQSVARDAAIAGMRIFRRRAEEQSRIVNPDAAPGAHGGFEVLDGVLPTGGTVSLRGFLGEGFSWERRRVELFRYAPDFGSRSIDVDEDHGLVYALLAPPHGIRFPELAGRGWSVETAELEQRLQTDLLFGLLAVLGFDTEPDPVIHRWSDDWSTFFRAGREWWGCYYWTVLMPRLRQVIVIGASTTD